jgi:hypothetical protein
VINKVNMTDFDCLCIYFFCWGGGGWGEGIIDFSLFRNRQEMANDDMCNFKLINAVRNRSVLSAAR